MRVLSCVPVILLCLILITSSACIAGSKTNEIFSGVLGNYNEPYLEDADLATFDYLVNSVPYHNPTSKLYSDYDHARYPSVYGSENPFISTSYQTYQLFTNPSANTNSMMYILLPYERYQTIGIRANDGYNEYTEGIGYIVSSHDTETRPFTNNIYKYNQIYENISNRLYHR